MSYTQLLYHVIIRTKGSKKVIPNEFSDELYKYITGYIRNKKSILFQINGTENHIHILFSLHPTLAMSDFIRELKTASNQWIKKQTNFKDFSCWGEKYAAFTCRISEKAKLILYIQNQRQHHTSIAFEDEYRSLISEAGIEIDEQYFLND